MAKLRCPTCDGPVDTELTTTVPFCSLRCKQIDLGRWLNEEYGMQVEPEDRVETNDGLQTENERFAD